MSNIKYVKTVHDLEQGKLYSVHKGMSGRDLKFYTFRGVSNEVSIEPGSILLFLEMEYQKEIQGNRLLYPFKLSFLWNNQIIFNIYQTYIELDAESRFSPYKIDVFEAKKKP